MRALILCDDPYHPGKIPESGLRAALPEAGFEVYTGNPAGKMQELSSYSAVFLCKSNKIAGAGGGDERIKWMEEAAEDALIRFVESGGGLMVLHAGITCYEDAGRYTEMAGGYFLSHPPACPVEFLAQGPLAEGVQPFTETDEHYHLRLLAEDAEIFLTARSTHGSQPAGYLRRRGAGRICVLTPGHTEAVWSNPAFQRLLQNAVRWLEGEGAN